MRKIIISIYCLVLSLALQAQAKYVFMFIGDGMGSHQVLSTEMYLAELEGHIGRKPLRMTTFPYSGQVATFSKSNGITDSAASGTCLASGKKTNNGVIGMDYDSTIVLSVASQLKQQAWGIGIMTTVTIDHATPSAHYAHAVSRNNYYQIGTQLTESNFDFFGGAGFSRPVNKDQVSAPNLYDLAEQKGYALAEGYYDGLKKIQKTKLIVVPEGQLSDRSKRAGALPYAIDQTETDLCLSQIVELSIAHLSKYERFFIMAEGGKIDYASHANDGGTMIHEVIDFDKAIDVAYQFYLQHPDETLIVVTADHETGGLALGNSDYTLNLKVLAGQKCSSDLLSDQLSTIEKEKGGNLTWEDVQGIISDNTGLYTQISLTTEEDAILRNSFARMMEHQEQVKTLYKDINKLAADVLGILNQKSRLGWTTNGHTASAVPIFAIGVGAENFTGWHDNSEIAPLIYQATQSPRK